MSVMSTPQFRGVVEPVLNEVFDGNYKKLPLEWTQVFTRTNAIPRSFQEDVMLAGFEVAKEKPEGAPVARNFGGEDLRAVYRHKTYATSFEFTEEMLEDGEHLSLAASYTEQMARAIAETEELVHADVFNRAFDPTAMGGDGVSLLANNHPMFNGSTFSNILQTPADLSETSLEAILTQIRLTPDSQGKKINLQGQKLIVAPANIFNATRIMESTLRSATANNDINAIKYLGLLPEGIVQLTRLLDDDAWFVETNAPRGLMHYDRARTEKKMEGSFETGGMRYKVRNRFSQGWTDPRGLAGSQGI